MKKLFFRFLIVISFFSVLFFGAILFVPEPESFLQIQETSKIYDRNGVLLYEILIPETGKQNFVSLDEISPYLKESVVAIEDRDFYAHSGVDLSAIFRAFWQNFYYGEIISGASTIEQQLARNLMQNAERTYFNKIKETALALKLSFKYEKTEILEKYLNTVYFGNLAYGVETASQTYFGKTSSKLDLAESAYLAGLPQSPNKFSPYADLTAGKARQQKVLEAMLVQKKISEADFQTALEETLKFQTQKLVNIQAPHFVMWVLQELREADLWEEIAQGGYKITTTLDFGLQQEIENLVNLHLKKLVSQNITNASVVVLDNQTGEVLAMLGSADYFDEKIDGEVNVALSLRQPGSTLKPFLYALAFEKGMTPQTMIMDEAVQFQSVDGHPYEPKNYDLQYHGKVSLREALAQSLNIPAVKILDYIGANVFLHKLNDLGLSSLNNSAEYYGLALALGSAEVSLFELTKAYAILANGGEKKDFVGIKEITKNENGLKDYNQNLRKISPLRPLSQTPVEMTQSNSILEKNAVRQVTSILTNNYARIPAFGEDNPLNFTFPVAAKTGTSRNFRDNWTLGYTAKNTVGVWVGNSDGSAMINSSGITGAGTLFHSIIQELAKVSEFNSKNGEALRAESLELRAEILDFEEVWKEKKKTLGNAEKTQDLILYPYAGDVFQLSVSIPLEKQVLTLKAREAGEWFLNGKSLGIGQNVDWQMQTGEFELKLQIGKKKESIHFSVR